MKVYTVLERIGWNIDDKFISSHLDKEVAIILSRTLSRYITEIEKELTASAIANLTIQDAALKKNFK
tara:strand:+ start:11102 stop:11302 length:201 start_codon:yes stop_codon:yes gene_type:complete